MTNRTSLSGAHDATNLTGGQAFPHVKNRSTDYGNGMTLRDYFAGQALPRIQISIHAMTEQMEDAAATAAKISYAVADAMLEARQKGGDA